jgi:hypothetical protein
VRWSHPRSVEVQFRLAFDERHQQYLLDVDQIDGGLAQTQGTGVPAQDHGQFRR